MRVGLKIDVTNTLGAMKGLPALLDLFDQYDVAVSLFISPDAFTNGAGTFDWLQKKRRAEEKQLLSRIAKSKHELGLLPLSTAQWLSHVAKADADWTRNSMLRSIASFKALFNVKPTMFAAMGWQINSMLLELEGMGGFQFASDTRGKHPYYPELLNVRGTCPQIPTTLPTLIETLQHPDVTEKNVHEYIYAESRYLLPAGHVYSASAAVEGIKYLSVMEKLLVMWRGQEGAVRSLGTMYNELDLESLPTHRIGWDCPQGATQHLATQSIAL